MLKEVRILRFFIQTHWPPPTSNERRNDYYVGNMEFYKWSNNSMSLPHDISRRNIYREA